MRQITRDAGQALRNRQPFKRGNTTVEVIERSRTPYWVKRDGFVIDENRRVDAKMRLHGHVIAEFHDLGGHPDCPRTQHYYYMIDSCGYMTHTTKERLNGIPGIQVVQKDWVWYLNGIEWDGSRVAVETNYACHDEPSPYTLYRRLEE